MNKHENANVFTDEDAQLPFTVMSLLDTCSLAMDDICEKGDGSHALRYASSVAAAVQLARCLLVDFHEKLDSLNRLEVTA